MLLALLGSATALAVEIATIARDVALRDKPLVTGAVVVPLLKTGTGVFVEAREGAWARVKTSDGKIGYVHLLNLRTSSGQQGASGISTVASVFATGSSGTSVATGVKGLSAEELRTGKPNPKAVATVAGYRVDAATARKAAAAAGLKQKTVAYLPDAKE